MLTLKIWGRRDSVRCMMLPHPRRHGLMHFWRLNQAGWLECCWNVRLQGGMLSDIHYFCFLNNITLLRINSVSPSNGSCQCSDQGGKMEVLYVEKQIRYRLFLNPEYNTDLSTVPLEQFTCFLWLTSVHWSSFQKFTLNHLSAGYTLYHTDHRIIDFPNIIYKSNWLQPNVNLVKSLIYSIKAWIKF